jgi:hypothetical protein
MNRDRNHIEDAQVTKMSTPVTDPDHDEPDEIAINTAVKRSIE